jgi:hypothetical protein
MVKCYAKNQENFRDNAKYLGDVNSAREKRKCTKQLRNLLGKRNSNEGESYSLEE